MLGECQFGLCRLQHTVPQLVACRGIAVLEADQMGVDVLLTEVSEALNCTHTLLCRSSTSQAESGPGNSMVQTQYGVEQAQQEY